MSSTPEQAAEPPRRKRWNPLSGLPTVVALVTLVSTVIGLVFLFKPGCAPQDVGTADISDIRVTKPVTFGRYLQKLELPPGTMSRGMLRRVGAMVSFNYQIKGFAGKSLPLRWELSDSATNALVDQDQAVTIKPSTNDEGRSWYVWVPVPQTKRKYYVTVTIYQPDGKVPLRNFDSPSFRGLSTG